MSASAGDHFFFLRIIYYSVPGLRDSSLPVYLSNLFPFLFSFHFLSLRATLRIASASVGFMLVMSSHPDMPATLAAFSFLLCFVPG